MKFALIRQSYLSLIIMLAIPQTRLDQLSQHLNTLDSPVWQTPINNLIIYQINEQSPQFAGIHRPAMYIVLIA